MTRAGKKLIDAARQAAEVAKCRHDFEELGPKRLRCKKCEALFYIPLTHEDMPRHLRLKAAVTNGERANGE